MPLAQHACVAQSSGAGPGRVGMHTGTAYGGGAWHACYVTVMQARVLHTLPHPLAVFFFFPSVTKSVSYMRCTTKLLVPRDVDGNTRSRALRFDYICTTTIVLRRRV